MENESLFNEDESLENHDANMNQETNDYNDAGDDTNDCVEPFNSDDNSDYDSPVNKSDRTTDNPVSHFRKTNTNQNSFGSLARGGCCRYCTCLRYYPSGAGSYCKCGHAFSDH